MDNTVAGWLKKLGDTFNAVFDATNNVLKVSSADTVPAGATQITAASGNVANAAAVATLAAAVGKKTYITGFEVTAAGSTAGLDVNVTVTGTVSGTLTYVFNFPTGALVGSDPLVVTFPRPIASSAANTAIVVTLPAGGAGNTHAAVVAHGFQL